MVSVVKMVIVLEDLYHRRAAFCYAFFVSKMSQCTENSLKKFPVYGGKCLSRKAVHNWVEKFSQGRSKIADDARPGAEVAETTDKRLLCCRFRSTGKAMGQVYQSWWGICREINVFPRFKYNMFYVIYTFVTYLLTLLRTNATTAV
jgi:hypothetical protein